MRPIYNERLVQAALGLLAVIVAAATVFNLWEVFVLTGQQSAAQARTAVSVNRARDLRNQAARIRASIDPRELNATIAAANEANALIDRRVFSWTELFNQFETTLPENVRISSVRPHVNRDGAMVVTIGVVARNVEAVDAFIEKLEKTGAFADLLSREEFLNEAGLIQASLEGRYLPGGTAQARGRGGRP
jgi:Tfp pilus assembly protein PilN